MKKINSVIIVMALLFIPAVVSATQTSRYESKGDEYMKLHKYRLAAATYKIALKFDPGNETLWEKHRQAIERGKAVEDYVTRGKAMLAKGFLEDAGNLFKEAVKLNPHDEALWRLYESTLVQNPDTVLIQSERDAWIAFKKGRSNFDAGHYEAAKRIFLKVAEATRDEKLLYYARDYLNRTQEKLRDFYPNIEAKTFHP